MLHNKHRNKQAESIVKRNDFNFLLEFGERTIWGEGGKRVPKWYNTDGKG